MTRWQDELNYGEDIISRRLDELDKGNTMNETWHSDTMKRFEGLTTDSLMYIRDDAKAAAEAGEGFNPKVGQYWDEYHYACMEIHKRQIS